jgi:hypothetical protein
MVNRLRHSAVATAVAACTCALCAPAIAQSLALSYKLDPVNAPVSVRPPPVVDRCSGLSWAAALAASCYAEAARAQVALPPPPAVAAPEANEAAAAPRRPDVADSYSAAETPTPSSAELPALGSPADVRLLRAGGGRDAYIGNARAVDLNFRFGSRYRMRSGEEGWEVYKFSDVTSENRIPSNGAKSLGVELLFPFQ